MSRRKRSQSEDYYWDGCPKVFRGNGMTFDELQKKHASTTWKLVRTSKRGNRIMFGERIVGNDTYGDPYYGGKAFATYIDAVVRPNDEVAEYTVRSDEWDY